MRLVQKDTDMTSPERASPDVVFVIIGRNEGERLRSCLSSVLAVSKQLVYADSASTDRSVELARSLGAVAVEVNARPLNAARGRNEGLLAARKHFPSAKFVQFLDGDCVLEGAWPTIARKFLEDNPDAAVVCGRRYELQPDASFYNSMADDEWNTPVGPAQACGGDSMMRIEALEEVGGFDPELMAGEEPELCARLRTLGWTVWRLGSPMTEHDANIMRFGQWWRRAVRSGFGYAQVWRRSSNHSRPIAAPQLRSAFLWTMAVPLAGIGAALALGRVTALLAIPAAYAMQFARIARGRRGSFGYRIRASALTMVAKFAEMAGALRFMLSSGYSGSIDYKSA